MSKKTLLISAILVSLVAIVAWRWNVHSPTEADDGNSPQNSGAVPAAVVPVERKDIANTLVISGEFKPFQDVDVHAKVAGYIRAIRVDVGDHVKEGQTLAELEIPELAAQLSGADAAA